MCSVSYIGILMSASADMSNSNLSRKSNDRGPTRSKPRTVNGVVEGDNSLYIYICGHVEKQTHTHIS